MTRPTLAQQSLVIVGTTGMVGGYALRYALDNSEVKNVTSIGRNTQTRRSSSLIGRITTSFSICSIKWRQLCFLGLKSGVRSVDF